MDPPRLGAVLKRPDRLHVPEEALRVPLRLDLLQPCVVVPVVLVRLLPVRRGAGDVVDVSGLLIDRLGRRTGWLLAVKAVIFSRWAGSVYCVLKVET